MAILCATDFSLCSRTATALAAALARRLKDKLVLFHVVQPPTLLYPETALMMPGYEASLVSAAEKLMDEQAAELRLQSIDVEPIVKVGVGPSDFHDLARRVEPQLVVVGSHGRPKAVRLLLGSFAEEVVRRATCPVIVVREAEVSRWSAGEPIRVAIGIDDQRSVAAAAVGWVARFARRVACDTSVIRPYAAEVEALRYGTSDTASKSGELATLVERDVGRYVPMAELPGASLRCLPIEADAVTVVDEESAHEGADAIVVGLGEAHRHRRDRIDAMALLRRARRPVICVPTKESAAEPLPTSRRVLVAIDVPGSARAVRAAYSLLPAGGVVELCHVHVRGLDVNRGEAAAATLSTKERTAIESQLRSLIPESEGSTGITTTVSIAEGATAPVAILQAVARSGADVLVLAPHRHSGAARWILGSVSEEVARESLIPVLLVPEPRLT